MGERRVELLRGRHALLRLTRQSDAERIVEWRNHADTARWLGPWEPLRLEEHLRWFRHAQKRGDLLLFFESLDHEPLGCTSLFDFDRPGTSAEWGRLVSARPGGGSLRMLEACYLLHRMCFEVLGCFRLHGRVWADNERAWRLYQFLGWVREGVRRQHVLAPDGYHDVLAIGVFPHEFRARRHEIESKLYAGQQAPEITEEDARRLRRIVGARIRRSLG